MMFRSFGGLLNKCRFLHVSTRNGTGNRLKTPQCYMSSFLERGTSTEPEIEEPSDQVKRLASELASSANATGQSNSTSSPHLSSSASKSQVFGISEEAKFLFNQTWTKLEAEMEGRRNVRLPSEIIWLMGSPGSGKGTTAPVICKARGITNPPIAISRLLKDDSIKALMDSGKMVGDQLVVEVLIRALMQCDSNVGVLVDGFPRTEIQVECLKLLHDKMHELRSEFAADPELKDKFRRPIFRMTVLYVDEAESLKRQLKRGQQVKEHNSLVKQTVQGELLRERVTDSDETLIRARYKVFQQHYGSIMRLKKLFPFHLINAFGSIDEVVRKIWHEFEYQSSLELDQTTFDSIQHIPIADKVGIHARQELVRRLESYQSAEANRFKACVELVEAEFIPAIRRHAISGFVNVRIDSSKIPSEREVDIVMDILSERGYRISAEYRAYQTPVRVCPDSWSIITEQKSLWIFGIRFPRHLIRGSFMDDFREITTGDISNTELSHDSNK